MNKIESRSFSSESEFNGYCQDTPIVYYYIFDGNPDQSLVGAFSDVGADEILVLLNVGDDKGFLAGTRMTSEILRDPIRFVSKPLSEFRGVGSRARGVPIGFANTLTEIPKLIRDSRRYARREPR